MMTSKPSPPPLRERWTDELLEPLRSAGDSVADPVIASTFASNDVGTVNRMLRSIEHNDHIVPAEMPDAIEDFLNQTDDWPAWADAEKIRLGQQLFSRYGMEMTLALFTWSLPSCYSCAKGARVLAWTNRIDKYVDRRIIETAQFLLDVMAPGGLERGGYGVRTAQKIRLLHATIRYHILQDPSWRQADWGTPINQEDQAGTLLSFALLPRVLTRLGLDFTAAEEEAFFHAWKVIGHIMGIDARLLATSPDDGQALWDSILRRQMAPSEAGRKLTQALIGHMKQRIPGELFDGLPAVFIRELCGDELAEVLGVEEADWTRRLVGVMRWMFGTADEAQDRSRLVARVAGGMARRLIEGLHTVERGGKRVTFRIPESLQDSWSTQSS